MWSVDRLFLSQKSNAVNQGLRTHHDEYFEPSFVEIALQIKKWQVKLLIQKSAENAHKYFFFKLVKLKTHVGP